MFGGDWRKEAVKNAAAGSDTTYANDVPAFVHTAKQLQACRDALKSYESAMKAVGPAFVKVQREFGTLYSGADGDPNIPHGAAVSAKNIEAVMKDFEKEQESILKAMDSYIKSLQAVESEVKAQDKLFVAMKDAEKTRDKTKEPKRAEAEQKLNAAKAAFEVKHVDAAAHVHSCVAKKWTTIDPLYANVMNSSSKVFSTMSQQAQLPASGASGKRKK